MSTHFTPLSVDMTGAALLTHPSEKKPSFTVAASGGWLWFDSAGEARSLAALITQGAAELDALTAARVKAVA